MYKLILSYLRLVQEPVYSNLLATHEIQNPDYHCGLLRRPSTLVLQEDVEETTIRAFVMSSQIVAESAESADSKKILSSEALINHTNDLELIVDFVRKQLKRGLKKYSEKVCWHLEWDQNPPILQLVANTDYYILGTKVGIGCRALRIAIWPADEDAALAVTWFQKKYLAKEVTKILDSFLPIYIGWHLAYMIKQSTTDVNFTIDIAQAGSMVLGSHILGEEIMQDEKKIREEDESRDTSDSQVMIDGDITDKIINLVKNIYDNKPDARKDNTFREQLRDILLNKGKKFKNGEIITAEHFNIIWENMRNNNREVKQLIEQLKILKDKLDKLERLQPSYSQSEGGGSDDEHNALNS